MLNFILDYQHAKAVVNYVLFDFKYNIFNFFIIGIISLCFTKSLRILMIEVKIFFYTQHFYETEFFFFYVFFSKHIKIVFSN